MEKNIETAIFGGGCFWCTEAIFKDIKGVINVNPGYSGGEKENPTYEEVSGGNTGHVEVIKIEFDKTQVSFAKLLEVFFATHNPTTLNKQGNDVGTQYRSVIFCMNNEQKEEAERKIKELTENKTFDKEIVTKVEDYKNFFPAEDYHKNYYESHKDAPYCMLVIAPKIEKFSKKFGDIKK